VAEKEGKSILKFQAVLKIFPWNPMQVKGKLGRKGREV
jgi:hypothetical protein